MDTILSWARKMWRLAPFSDTLFSVTEKEDD